MGPKCCTRAVTIVKLLRTGRGEWWLGQPVERCKDAEKVVQKPASRCTSCDVYVYFDNDAKVRAPGDALSLITRIKQLQTSAKDA